MLNGLNWARSPYNHAEQRRRRDRSRRHGLLSDRSLIKAAFAVPLFCYAVVICFFACDGRGLGGRSNE
jgi:hypothetical protein